MKKKQHVVHYPTRSCDKVITLITIVTQMSQKETKADIHQKIYLIMTEPERGLRKSNGLFSSSPVAQAQLLLQAYQRATLETPDAVCCRHP